jgi:hypothetical protein
VVLAVLRSRKDYTRNQEFLEEVGELARFCAARDAFVKNPAGAILGPLFRGIETEWPVLEELVAFSQMLRQELGLEKSQQILADWNRNVDVLSDACRRIEGTLAKAALFASDYPVPKAVWERPSAAIVAILQPWCQRLRIAADDLKAEWCGTHVTITRALQAAARCESAMHRENQIERSAEFGALLRPEWQRSATDRKVLHGLLDWFVGRQNVPGVNFELIRWLLPEPRAFRRERVLGLVEVAKRFSRQFFAALKRLKETGETDVVSWVGGKQSNFDQLCAKMNACRTTAAYLPVLARWARAHDECSARGLGEYSKNVSE